MALTYSRETATHTTLSNGSCYRRTFSAKLLTNTILKQFDTQKKVGLRYQRITTPNCTHQRRTLVTQIMIIVKELLTGLVNYPRAANVLTKIKVTVKKLLTGLANRPRAANVVKKFKRCVAIGITIAHGIGLTKREVNQKELYLLDNKPGYGNLILTTGKSTFEG